MNELFRDGTLGRIVFLRSAAQLQLTRLQRMRSLAQINRLTAALTAKSLRDPSDPAPAELLAVINRQSQRHTPSQSLTKISQGFTS